MNLFLQYKVGRDVVRNAAVLAPAQRSIVKRRVRSGHFDHDFWNFTLLLVGLRNENAPKRREFGTTSGSGTLV